MKFIRTLFKTDSEKQETKRQNALRQQAEELIESIKQVGYEYLAEQANEEEETKK